MTLTASKQELWEKLTAPANRARLMASAAPHAGDWLLALPISSCGLRFENEAIQVAVGLHLGVFICESHTCPCGALVNALGTHSLSCRLGSGRMARHQQLNDLCAGLSFGVVFRR